MLADTGPPGHEVGVLNGRVSPGDVVAVVGAGPVGLTAIMGAALLGPAHVVAIDQADARLAAPQRSRCMMRSPTRSPEGSSWARGTVPMTVKPRSS